MTAISAVASALLSIWYLTAIVGIDIHVDHHDGKVYVVSMLAHTDCESLHPGDECHCLEHHSGLCHGDDEDCENLVSFLSVTGDGFHFTCHFAPATFLQTAAWTPAPFLAAPDHFCPHRSFHAPPREHLNSLCVSRV